jgi:hypothetical protein
MELDMYTMDVHKDIWLYVNWNQIKHKTSNNLSVYHWGET